MAAESLAQSFLREHPDLRPFLLSYVRATGRTIGSGSYGSVEEVAVLGAVCAAKKIHDFFQDPSRMPREGIERAASEFVRECQLMSTLRHPHIVQFLGVCFLPGSRMPALVMEKLATSLHDILDPEPPPPTKPFVPVSLKRSILHDVARGLSFLHSHSPPIIHRDLSARNVLLNEGMVAKITDLGMARIVPGLRASTMTKAPGASIYMPPEALEDESRYDITIDIFSFGVLAIFTLSQMFPKPLAPTYMDMRRMIVGRTELERRGNYMQEVTRQFREGHPFIQMIRRCLSNITEERPSIHQVLWWLGEARAEVQDGEYDANKLSLAQLLQSRSQENQSLRGQNDTLRGLYDSLKEQNDVKDVQIASLQEQVQSVQAENATLKQSQMTTTTVTAPKPVMSGASPLSPSTPSAISLTPAMPGTTSDRSNRWSLSLNWRKRKDIPTENLVGASSVTLNGMVYCGGGFDKFNSSVIWYNPVRGDWSELPEPFAWCSSMTALNGQLVLAGGGGNDTIIRVWDSVRSEWVHPYPPMPTGRVFSAVVGYQNYLIVACGEHRKREVEVLDSSSGRWYSAQPVPVGGHHMSSVVVGDCWYLSSFGEWEDGKEHIFWAHLPTLISNATSTHAAQHTWYELPTSPIECPTLLALQGQLLLVGGKGRGQRIHCYDREIGRWRVCGQLPVGVADPCCAVLPSGDLMVAGGYARDTGGASTRMWIAKTRIS